MSDSMDLQIATAVMEVMRVALVMLKSGFKSRLKYVPVWDGE